MESDFKQRMLAFNAQLSLDGIHLPAGVEAMNPFKGEHAGAVAHITTDFYQKYYADTIKRIAIFGINPGRMGAGLTGVPFADTWCLQEKCNISTHGIETRETSARFIFALVDAFGGPDRFFGKFYIGAVSPLGYVKQKAEKSWVNYNYYDSKALQQLLTPAIERWYQQQYNLGVHNHVAFCLGTGKNRQFLESMNRRIPLFKKIVALEHPRYIMQYKNREKDAYIKKFADLLHQA